MLVGCISKNNNNKETGLKKKKDVPLLGIKMELF